jgi:hypothetical protein
MCVKSGYLSAESARRRALRKCFMHRFVLQSNAIQLKRIGACALARWSQLPSSSRSATCRGSTRRTRTSTRSLPHTRYILPPQPIGIRCGFGSIVCWLGCLWSCLSQNKACSCEFSGQYKPRDFASQINMNLAQSWGILKGVVDLCIKLPEGRLCSVAPCGLAGLICKFPMPAHSRLAPLHVLRRLFHASPPSPALRLFSHGWQASISS